MGFFCGESGDASKNNAIFFQAGDRVQNLRVRAGRMEASCVDSAGDDTGFLGREAKFGKSFVCMVRFKDDEIGKPI